MPGAVKKDAEVWLKTVKWYCYENVPKENAKEKESKKGGSNDDDFHVTEETVKTHTRKERVEKSGTLKQCKISSFAQHMTVFCTFWIILGA